MALASRKRRVGARSANADPLGRRSSSTHRRAHCAAHVGGEALVGPWLRGGTRALGRRAPRSWGRPFWLDLDRWCLSRPLSRARVRLTAPGLTLDGATPSGSRRSRLREPSARGRRGAAVLVRRLARASNGRPSHREESAPAFLAREDARVLWGRRNSDVCKKVDRGSSESNKGLVCAMRGAHSARDPS